MSWALPVRPGVAVFCSELHEVGVKPGPFNEIVVMARLDNRTAVEDNDSVRVPDGDEAMGDNDGGSSGRDSIYGLLDHRLGLGVERASWLVEEKDSWIPDYSPS